MGLFFFTVFTPFSEFAGFQKTGGRGGREIFFLKYLLIHTCFWVFCFTEVRR
jgi:hypothetical protein